MAYPAETKALALKLYQSGLSVRQVSDELNVPNGTAHWWLRKAGIRRNRVELHSPAVKARALALRADGWDCISVAREVGVPTPTLRNWINAEWPDLKQRPPIINRYSGDQKRRVYAMLSEGTRWVDISAATGVPVQRIDAWARLRARGPQPMREAWLSIPIGPMPKLPGAMCRGGKTAVFFDEAGKEDEAKAICAVCPERPACLDWALRNHEKFGIWGGLNSRERERMRRHADARGAANG